MGEDNPLAMEGQAEGHGEKFPSGHVEPAADRPISPIPVAPEPHDHQVVLPLPPSDDGALWTSIPQLSHGRAELVEH